MALSDIYQKASLVQIPSGYKSGTLYSVVPNTADGDFTVTGDPEGEATRVNKDGLIETVSANVPRLNYDPSSPQDPHLLLEPTRTNIITQSTELTSGSLAKVNLTVSDNTSIVDPQGRTDTKTLTATSTSQPRLEWRGTAVPASNTSYAMSFWVRYSTARYVAIAHFSQTGEYAIFDLLDGEVESDVGTQTAKIEAYPNGWYRVSKSFEVPSSASLNYWKFTLCTQTNAFVGVSGEKADVFGLQLEVGSYPSSLIPTSGNAVTRTVDSNEISSGLGSLFNQTEGTIFLDFEYLYETTSDSSTDALRDLFTIGTATNQSDVIFIDNYRSQFRIFLVQNNVYNSLGDNSEGAAEANTRYKLAFRYKSGDSKSYLNGSLLGTNSANIDFNGTLQGIFFSENNSGRSLKNQKKVYQLMVFNEALTDSELQTLTT